jgi:hypothetical protein
MLLLLLQQGEDYLSVFDAVRVAQSLVFCVL